MDTAGTQEVTEEAAVVWMGAEGLRPLLVPIDSIANHPRNPRRGNLDVVTESLEYFGQLRPVIVHRYANQEQPFVVAGNHTRLSAKERIGWSEIAAVAPDMSDDEADRFLIMDNRSSDLAENDNTLLLEILNEMMNAGRLEGTGYTPDHIDDLSAEIGAVAEAAEQPFQGGYAESPEETAARFTTPGEGVRMKEALLMYPEAQFEEFQGMLRALKAAWGIEGARSIVFEAVRHCALEVEGESTEATPEAPAANGPEETP